MSIFRQYTFDDSFEQVFVSSKFLKEYQIALTFATDYDENGVPTNGVFRPTWDQTKVTPSAITRFKKEHPDVTVKVYISIGNKGTKFPFSPQDNKSWIANATQSLTRIIKSDDYNLQVDGIDVFYEHIDASPIDFGECVGQLITNLKDKRVIKEASISPSCALNKDYYIWLYGIFALCIDWVDYQFQKEVIPVYSPDDLENRYKILAVEYPKRKLIAGYSAENEDWATLSPIVFFLGGMNIIGKKIRGAGISIHYHNYYNQPPPSASGMRHDET